MPDYLPERLQKVLAAAGIGSRRTCEAWIEQGRVRVNGEIVTELGTKVDPAIDKIAFDGRIVTLPSRRYYIALNKPRGIVTTLADVHAARIVTDLIDLQSKPLLRPVGRLDADSEGLLFLTDDGDFLFKLTHPRHHVPKTYRATVRGIPDADALNQLAQGIRLEDGMTAPAENVRLRHSTREENGPGRAEVELTIYEGRNRQVRRMFTALGHPVIRLIRTQIGGIRLSGLPSGAWRHLTHNEIAALMIVDEASQPEQKSPQEKQKLWQTAPRPSKRPKAPSSPISSRATRPSRPRTSSSSPKKASTTD